MLKIQKLFRVFYLVKVVMTVMVKGYAITEISENMILCYDTVILT